MVERSLSMREVAGSMPAFSRCFLSFITGAQSTGGVASSVALLGNSTPFSTVLPTAAVKTSRVSEIAHCGELKGSKQTDVRKVSKAGLLILTVVA